MKVVLLAPTPPPAGGIAGWTDRMLKTKLKNNWEVVVVDEKLTGNRKVFTRNRRNLFEEVKRTLRIWRDLYLSLRDEKVAVVHSCIPATTFAMIREFFCMLITRLYKKKFIIHYRCTLPNMVKSSFSRKVFKLLTDNSDFVITLNKKSEEFVNLYSNTPTKIVPNFIATNTVFNGNVKEKLETVLYVGGVTRTKGCLDVIEVAREFPELRFELIGQPSEELLKIEKPSNVLLLGEQKKEIINSKLKESDAFMFLSYYEGEGFSNALLEAMAAGLPCIVTDWAANADMIENKGGYVVPVKDYVSVIDYLKKLQFDYKLRLEQSEWNIKKVQSNYTDQLVTSVYVDIYESLI